MQVVILGVVPAEHFESYAVTILLSGASEFGIRYDPKLRNLTVASRAYF